jgi:hypothetical protein
MKTEEMLLYGGALLLGYKIYSDTQQLTSGYTGAVKNVGDIFSNFTLGIKQFLDSFTKGATNLKNLNDLGTEAGNEVTNWFHTGLNGTNQAATDISSIWNNILNNTNSLVTGFVDNSEAWFGGITNTFLNQANSATSQAFNIDKTILDNVNSLIPDVYKAWAGNASNDLTNEINKDLSNPLISVFPVGWDWLGGIVGGVKVPIV